MGVFKKRVNEFPTPYTCMNAIRKGGIETKLSMILMGFGNIVHGQLIKATDLYGAGSCLCCVYGYDRRALPGHAPVAWKRGAAGILG